MRDELGIFFRAHADSVHGRAYQLLTKIYSLLVNSGNEDQQLFGGRVIDQVRDADRDAFAGLSNAFQCLPDSGFNDTVRLQELVGQYYERYQWLTTWIHQAGERVHFPFDSDKDYARWKENDRDFLRELRVLIAKPDYEVLRNKVQNVGWGEAFR